LGDGQWRIEAASDLLAGVGHRGDHWSHLVAATVMAVAARQCAPALAGEARRQAERLTTELGAPVLLAAIDRLVARLPASPAVDERTDHARSAAVVVSSARAAGEGLVEEQVVELTCLGGFALRVHGREVDCHGLRPRARTLLMLLAVHHGKSMHRELIIEALWPEAPLASGIRSLQVAVSSVRQCLAAGGVTVDPIRRHGDAYELFLPDIVSDLVEFERLADDSRRRAPSAALTARIRALDLYRGDLLPEVGPADWVVEERDRLRLLAAAVGAAAAADAVAVGDHERAIQLARRSIALDPFHDPAWSLLIDAYESLGDLSAAAVARSDHQRVWDDLGLVVPQGRRVLA
jgi:DNA-binding SARP family transcriptional activator